MKTDDTLPFDLSLDELHWLTGAFGIVALPLPEHPQSDLSRAELMERQKKGHASLLRRGLIQPSPGFGWQVDRLPAAFVQWMASAESMLRVKRIEKEGGKKMMHIFTSSGQALSVEIADETAHFILYKTRATMNDSLNVWLMFPPKPVKSKKIFSIPQPQTFIPVAWKDQQLAGKILANAGFKNPKDLLEWTKALDWLVILSKLRVNGKSNGASDQFFLCGNNKSLWGGGVEKESVSFTPIGNKELDAAIGNML